MQTVNVKIFSSAIDALGISARKQSPNETGGVLLGTRNLTSGALEYNILGSLGVADFEEFDDTYIASPTTFECRGSQQWSNLVIKAIKTFGMSYIGDWHSHPNSNFGTLSQRDIDMLVDQSILDQFYPFPPLHVLLQWSSINQDMKITANIMLDNQLIIVLGPEIIAK